MDRLGFGDELVGGSGPFSFGGSTAAKSAPSADQVVIGSLVKHSVFRTNDIHFGFIIPISYFGIVISIFVHGSGLGNEAYGRFGGFPGSGMVGASRAV
jgi:hypothetical protein